MSKQDSPVQTATQTIDRYCQVWSEQDRELQTQILLDVWNEQATYTDPTVSAQGADALLVHIGRIQQSRPGARVVRTTALDFHHNVAMFEFQAVSSTDEVLREGTDIVFFAEEGKKILQVIGFFELPSSDLAG